MVRTDAYSKLVARAVLGEIGLNLKPVELRLGTGRYANGVVTPPKRSDTDLANPVLSGITSFTLSNVGGSVRVQAQVPGSSTPYTITEAGLFTADGIAVILDAFRPRTLVTPFVLEFFWPIFPEVEL